MNIGVQLLANLGSGFLHQLGKYDAGTNFHLLG
jgi:hypothetical protein